MEDLSEMCHVLRSRTRAAIAKVSDLGGFLAHTWRLISDAYNCNICVDFQVREYQGSFASYRYLWTDDRSDVIGSLSYFLFYIDQTSSMLE